jgi:hypothetical protein
MEGVVALDSVTLAAAFSRWLFSVLGELGTELFVCGGHLTRRH